MGIRTVTLIRIGQKRSSPLVDEPTPTNENLHCSSGLTHEYRRLPPLQRKFYHCIYSVPTHCNMSCSRILPQFGSTLYIQMAPVEFGKDYAALVRLSTPKPFARCGAPELVKCALLHREGRRDRSTASPKKQGKFWSTNTNEMLTAVPRDLSAPTSNESLSQPSLPDAKSSQKQLEVSWRCWGIGCRRV